MSELPDSVPPRDDLGRLVREEWVAWAREQANPKPHWLTPYDDLSEEMKEVDRRIGEAVAAHLVVRLIKINGGVPSA